MNESNEELRMKQWCLCLHSSFPFFSSVSNALCIHFYIKPAPVIRSIQFHYCTDSNPRSLGCCRSKTSRSTSRIRACQACLHLMFMFIDVCACEIRCREVTKACRCVCPDGIAPSKVSTSDDACDDKRVFFKILFYCQKVSLSHAIMDAMCSDDSKWLLFINRHFVCAVTCPCSYHVHGNCTDASW